MNELQQVCEFLKSVEEEHPIPAHADLYTGWEEDVREFWRMWMGDEGNRYEEILDEVLEFRKKIHYQRETKEEKRDSIDTYTMLKEQKGWEWLLHVKQIEQRTDEWLAEGKEILTASEIGALWKGPGTRAGLVKKKASPPAPYVAQQAVPKDTTGPMDWGVRYEPVVKEILQHELSVKIIDLGRIRHRNIEKLGASPDGLIIEGPEEYVGRLVEIKCPPTRTLTDKVPIEYWYQMQIQMEICDRPLCEYVEVKFKQIEESDVKKEKLESKQSGYIELVAHKDTLLHKYNYIYSNTNETRDKEDEWIVIERYGWEVEKIQRILVLRDKAWFESIQNDLKLFWNDVEACKNGSWVYESKRKKKEQPVEKCYIQDDQADENNRKEDIQIPVKNSRDDIMGE